MHDSERPRRPGKVILLVVALWIAGGVLQTVFGTLVASGDMVDAGTATRIGQVLGWGLLILVFFYFRHQLEHWLRS